MRHKKFPLKNLIQLHVHLTLNSRLLHCYCSLHILEKSLFKECTIELAENDQVHLYYGSVGKPQC